MRATEFLVEYNRNITIQQIGDKLITALASDTGNMSDWLDNVRKAILGYTSYKVDGKLPEIPEDKKKQMLDLILQYIETRDPTQNKVYTPWLARVYSKGGVKFEDLNRGEMLQAFDEAKRRRLLQPQHRDINSFKTYSQFEDAMFDDPGYHTMVHDAQREEELGQPEAKKVYEDSEVLVVIPQNEAAACKYGKGTRWCTASTQGYNYFDQYNRQGKLYILIPKSPDDMGEKYQLHFPSNQFMDQYDTPISLHWLFYERFNDENLRNYFIKNEPGIQNTVSFAPDEVLTEVIGKVADLANEFINEIISEWEINDDYYRKYLEKEGYVDEYGDIDYDKAYKNNDSYLEYNYEAEKWYDDAKKVVRPTVDQLRAFIAEREDDQLEVTHLEYTIADMVKQHFGIGRTNDMGLEDFLKRNIVITGVVGDDGKYKYNVGYVKRAR